MENKRTRNGRDRQGAGRATTNQPSSTRRATASEVRAQDRYARSRYGAQPANPTKRTATSQPAADDAAAQRLSRDEYAKTHKHKKHGKLFYAGIAALAVVLIGAGAAFAYVQVLSGNLHAGLGNVGQYLVKTNMTKEPFYMLLMGTDGSAERDESGDFGDSYRTDSIMLARIDPVGKKVTLVSLHRDTMVDMGEYGVNKLNAAHVFGGPALSVQTVSQLAGVDISHYAEINFDGFHEIVDALGGIEVDVPMTIDDEDAGGHLDAGLQTLNGDQALILCRARHAYDEIGPGDEYRAANQRLVISAIAKKLLSADAASMASTVQALSKYVTTDLGVTDIIGLAQAMQGLDPSTDIYSAMEPTTSEYIDGVWYEINNTAEWKAMMKRVDSGLPPTDGDVVDKTSGTILATTGDGMGAVKRGGTVAIRNGNGVSGAGFDATERIQGLGYSVNTSNADNFDYRETLVVYNDPADKEAAEAIVKALGVGKAEQNANTYLFEEDFLIVLGADWQ